MGEKERKREELHFEECYCFPRGENCVCALDEETRYLSLARASREIFLEKIVTDQRDDARRIDRARDNDTVARAGRI